MATYKYEVVAKYSDYIEVEADNEDRAYNLAIESAPGWISLGSKMAYVESVDAYPLTIEEN